MSQPELQIKLLGFTEQNVFALELLDRPPQRNQAVANARHQHRQGEHQNFGVAGIHQQRFEQQGRSDNRHRAVKQ